MPRLGIGLNRKHSSSATAVFYSGLVAVSNATTLSTITVKKSDLKGKTPPTGYHITLPSGKIAVITSYTTSGANYIITFTGTNVAFSGGGNLPWSIRR